MFISIYFLSLADKFLFVYFTTGGILMHAGRKTFEFSGYSPRTCMNMLFIWIGKIHQTGPVDGNIAI